VIEEIRAGLAREVFTPLDFDTWQATVLTLWREATYREALRNVARIRGAS
jgi:hypothetical protein